jgi:voltage-gated potassium channel
MAGTRSPGGVPRRRSRYFLDLFGRVWKFLAAFASVYVVSGVLFYLLEAGRISLFNSLYWSMVTIGTVGYGDFVPTNDAARVLTEAVIATQIFLLAYLITVITSAVTEESQRRALGTYGTDFREHIIVLGYEGVGRAAVRELLVQGQTVAVVTERSDEVSNLRTLGPEDRLFATFGAPGERDILERVNIAEAHSVIICTPDDATNMIAALNVRALNPKVRVVVSVARTELRETLKSAGVTYVSSPADMGGRLCAAAAFEPDVAHAVEDMTAADVHSDIQEYVLPDRSPLTGRTFAEADQLIRTNSGCILIGYAHPDGRGEYETIVNPPFETRLAAKDAVVLVGTLENVARFRKWFGSEQGR